jgi:hypothetical protein
MKTLINKLSQMVQITRGDVGVWIGEVRDGNVVVAERVPLDRALRSHFSLGMYTDWRWRFVENADTVFWWNFADVTVQQKHAVEQWLGMHGMYVHKHAGNGQMIRVAGQTMLAANYSHGNGPRSWRKMRVVVVGN